MDLLGSKRNLTHSALGSPLNLEDSRESLLTALPTQLTLLTGRVTPGFVFYAQFDPSAKKKLSLVNSKLAKGFKKDIREKKFHSVLDQKTYYDLDARKRENFTTMQALAFNAASEVFENAQVMTSFDPGVSLSIAGALWSPGLSDGDPFTANVFKHEHRFGVNLLIAYRKSPDVPVRLYSAKIVEIFKDYMVAETNAGYRKFRLSLIESAYFANLYREDSLSQLFKIRMSFTQDGQANFARIHMEVWEV